MPSQLSPLLNDISDLFKCQACGFCRITCPVFKVEDHLESVSPRSKLLLLQGVQRGDLEPTKRIAEKLAACALCARCTLECPGGVKVHEAVMTARRVFRDHAPSAVKLLKNNLIEKNNPFGLPDKLKVKWVQYPNPPRGGETLLFATCGYPYMKYGEALTSILHMLEKRGIPPEIPSNMIRKMGRLGRGATTFYGLLAAKHGYDIYSRALASALGLLRSMGIEAGYLYEKEPCCGYPLHIWGFDEEFSEHARKVYNGLKTLGAKKLIVMTPACAEALRDVYPHYLENYDLQILHFIEVVKQGLDEGSITMALSEPLKVTFHDPCQMARYLKLSDQIRDILHSIEGLKLLEVEPNSGVATRCCGGGGSLEVVDPDLSARMAVARARELLDTGARVIVTCCPACVMNLKRGVNELKKDMEILDLAELLYHAVAK